LQFLQRGFVFGGKLDEHRRVFHIALELIGFLDSGFEAAALT
jgi:hypothetical protein